MIRETFWRIVWGLTRSQRASEEISEARLARRIARMIKSARCIEIHE